MTDIINGELMAQITGCKTAEKQIEVLSKNRIHFWLDAKDRPVTIAANLQPMRREAKKPKAKLRLAGGQKAQH